MFRRTNGAGVNGKLALLDNAVGNLLEEQVQVYFRTLS